MESKYFLLANTHTKTIQGIPFEVIELDRGSLREMSTELNELNALIKITTASLQKISPPEVLTAMQGISRITSKLSGCLAEILSPATTTALPVELPASLRREVIVKQHKPLNAPYDGGLPLGDRIQLARENLGLTEADIARALNTYSDHISDWECGITEPPASMVIPLAHALKCDPLWLLGRSTGPSEPTKQPHATVKIMPGVNMSAIGNRIRQRRNELSMSTMDLAKKTGTHLMDVVNWESGLIKPEAPHIDALAKALNTSVTWLLTDRHVTPQAQSESEGRQHCHAAKQADA